MARGLQRASLLLPTLTVLVCLYREGTFEVLVVNSCMKQRNHPAVSLNTPVRNLRQLPPDENCERFAAGEGDPRFRKAALTAEMPLVSLPLTRLEHGLQAKWFFSECRESVWEMFY